MAAGLGTMAAGSGQWLRALGRWLRVPGQWLRVLGQWLRALGQWLRARSNCCKSWDDGNRARYDRRSNFPPPKSKRLDPRGTRSEIRAPIQRFESTA
jgi:hypothetical protein